MCLKSVFKLFLFTLNFPCPGIGKQGDEDLEYITMNNKKHVRDHCKKGPCLPRI